MMGSDSHRLVRDQKRERTGTKTRAKLIRRNGDRNTDIEQLIEEFKPAFPEVENVGFP